MSAETITADAEAASHLLFRTLADHRRTVANLPPRKKRRLPMAGDDAEQIQCQATLIRMLSITESFCAERLLRQVEEFVAPSRHMTISKVWDDAAVDATRRWEDQQKAYRQWLGVSLNWTVVEQLKQARNAVAHGLGHLTRQQLRNKQSVTDKIKAAGFTVDNDRIVLSDAGLEAAAVACRDLIERLDLAVQTRPMSYR